jgi:hypothetical protein
MSTMELTGHTDSVVSVGFNASGQKQRDSGTSRTSCSTAAGTISKATACLHASKRRGLRGVETHSAAVVLCADLTKQLPYVQAVNVLMHAL